MTKGVAADDPIKSQSDVTIHLLFVVYGFNEDLVCAYVHCQYHAVFSIQITATCHTCLNTKHTC